MQFLFLVNMTEFAIVCNTIENTTYFSWMIDLCIVSMISVRDNRTLKPFHQFIDHIKIFAQDYNNQLTCTCATSPTVNRCRMSSSSSVIAPCFKATLERNSSEAFKRSEHQWSVLPCENKSKKLKIILKPMIIYKVTRKTYV